MDTMSRHRIVRQTAAISSEKHADTRKTKYRILIFLRDAGGYEHVYEGKTVYNFDETGKAHFDLACVATANFNNEK
jgi:hypothetical protein